MVRAYPVVLGDGGVGLSAPTRHHGQVARRVIGRIADFFGPDASSDLIEAANNAYGQQSNELMQANLMIVAAAFSILPEHSRERIALELIRTLPQLNLPLKVAIPDKAELGSLLAPLLPMNAPETCLMMIRSLIIDGTRDSIPDITSRIHNYESRAWAIAVDQQISVEEAADVAAVRSSDAPHWDVVRIANEITESTKDILLHPELTANELRSLYAQYKDDAELLRVLVRNKALPERLADEAGRAIGIEQLDGNMLSTGNFSPHFSQKAIDYLSPFELPRQQTRLARLLTNPKCTLAMLGRLLLSGTGGSLPVRAQAHSDPRTPVKAANDALRSLLDDTRIEQLPNRIDAAMTIATRPDINAELAVRTYDIACNIYPPSKVLETLNSAPVMERHREVHGSIALSTYLTESVLNLNTTARLLTTVDWQALAGDRATAIWAAARSSSPAHQNVRHGAIALLQQVTTAVHAGQLQNNFGLLDWKDAKTGPWRPLPVPPVPSINGVLQVDQPHLGNPTAVVVMRPADLHDLTAAQKSVLLRAWKQQDATTFAAVIDAGVEETFAGVWQMVDGAAQEVVIYNSDGHPVDREGPALTAVREQALTSWTAQHVIEHATTQTATYTLI